MRIRIDAPSSPPPLDTLAAGVARLRAAGMAVEDASGVVRGRHAYLNGDDGARAASLVDALAADVDVLWLARGGYGLTRILSRIAAPRGRSPTVIGFSDATALFAHLWGQGIHCVHGPLATTLAAEPADSFEHCLAVLERRARGTALPLAAGAAVDVEGRLFAGNLCVLCALVGTPSFPNLDGAVLVLEEVGERPYRVDRMLTQLLAAGALSGVRAVVAGHLTNCVEPTNGSGARDAAPAALDVFAERLGAAGIPLATGLHAGHAAPNRALPLGARARVQAGAGGGALTLLEDLP
ncbi:MAG: LD-carboxypeptidase [Deltaproteobacteria bacterium]|nr:LD-carboxypeptidase [Deltaproteobacteria bacterium]